VEKGTIEKAERPLGLVSGVSGVQEPDPEVERWKALPLRQKLALMFWQCVCGAVNNTDVRGNVCRKCGAERGGHP
jgi:hypothetical protein